MTWWRPVERCVQPGCPGIATRRYRLCAPCDAAVAEAVAGRTIPRGRPGSTEKQTSAELDAWDHAVKGVSA